MKEERMKILEMLQDGNISAEEAALLLGQIAPSVPEPSEGGFFTWVKDSIFSPGGPRIVAEFESAPVGNGIAGLRLVGMNDSVSIKGYRGDKIRVKCQYSSKKNVPPPIFHLEDGVYELRYDYDGMKAMKISCKVPMALIESLEAATSNGKLSLEELHCTKLNGTTSNGKLVLEGVRAAAARLRTSNGKLDVEDSDIANIFAETSNGSIDLECINTSESWTGEREMEVSTSNGGISLDLPRGLGVRLFAKTSNARVSCEMQDAIFGEVSLSRMDGKNQRYENAEKRIKIALTTSNGPIKIKEV